MLGQSLIQRSPSRSMSGTYPPRNNVTYDVSLCTPGQTNFTGYMNHWRMPGNASEANRNFWYSYDDGMVHVIFLDTETDLGGNLTGPDELVSPVWY